MFSDRFLWGKLLLLILIYGFICHLGGRVHAGESADLLDCLASPVAHHGSVILGVGYRVTSVRDGGFTIEDDEVPVRVHWDKPVKTGDRIEIEGTFQRDGTVRAKSVRVLPGFLFKRGVMLAGSIAALVCVFILILRSRPTRFSSGLIEERP